MKIYFAASIRGGRGDLEFYVGIINHLKNYGEILTEHIGDKKIAVMGEDDISDEQIHDRDMDWLKSADRIVAEVTNPSLGVGYEIGRVVERNKRVTENDKQLILCLYRPSPDRKLSAMIAGSEGVKNYEYNTLEDALKIIDGWFANHE